MVAVNVTPRSTLTSTRSIWARWTTTAASHIESHTQTYEPCLKLIFGWLLMPQPLPSETLFRGPPAHRVQNVRSASRVAGRLAGLIAAATIRNCSKVIPAWRKPP